MARGGLSHIRKARRSPVDFPCYEIAASVRRDLKPLLAPP